jgi:hypothetical protein
MLSNDIKCNNENCNSKAVWFYMPSSNIEYCDECVPRGCSCNTNHDDDDGDELEQDIDEFGRKYPCVEYYYIEDVNGN